MGFLFMTRQDYENKSFEEIMAQLEEEDNNIRNREELIDAIIYYAKDDNLDMVKHIAEGMTEEYSDWYDYDVLMGTMDRVVAITDKEDVEHLIEE